MPIMFLKKIHLVRIWTNWTLIYCWLKKAMATHCSTLAWKISWAEEPGGLQSMGLLGVGHDWVTSLSLFTFMHWRRKWQPTPVENPRDGRACWAAIYRVVQSWTRMKWFSSSSILLVVQQQQQNRKTVWSINITST